MSIPPSGGSRDIIVRIGLPEPDPLPGGDFKAWLLQGQAFVGSAVMTWALLQRAGNNSPNQPPTYNPVTS